MHHVLRPSLPRFIAIVTTGLLLCLETGCSASSRITRALEEAERDYASDRFDEAEIEYKNVLQIDGQNAAAISRLGHIFHAQGRDARALAFLEKGKELQPTDLETRLRFGLASLATGNTKDARAEAIYLLPRLPQNEQVTLLLVEASTSTELEDARQQLLSLPQSAATLVALGEAALRQNRMKEAETAFQTALALEPKSVGAQSGLGVLHWALNDLPAADAAFRRASEASSRRSPKRLQYAQFKLQTGDLAGGRKLLETISQESPDYLPVWVWLAELAAMEKKFDESETLLARALARDPLHAEALLLGARVKIAKGEIDKGITELERLRGLFPKSAQISYQLGLALTAKGETNQALTQLTQAAATLPQAALAIGEIGLRTRNFNAALAALRPLVQQNPELIEARILLADTLRHNGNLDEASALYVQLEAERPGDAAIVFSRGLTLLAQNRESEARQLFLRVRELVPGHPGAATRLTELDLAGKRHAAARERLEEDMTRAPQSASHALLLAQVSLDQGDSVAAEAALKRVLALQPDSPVAQFQLARIYMNSQEPLKAIANLEAATKSGPPNFAALLLLAIIRDERKEYPAAREAYEKALALQPKSALVLNNLACLYSEQFNEIDKAYDLALRARGLQPLEPRTADTYGWILVKKKQYAAAVTVLQESAMRLPEEPEVQFHLGTASYLLGDEQRARVAFDRALALSGSFAAAGEARERLAIIALDPQLPPPADRAAQEQRLQQRKDDPVARLRLGLWSEHDGALDPALGHYRAILDENPENLGALLGTARIHAAKNELPKAFEAAKAARAVAPNDPAAAHLVGRLAFATGDYKWAASILNEAARLRTDDAELLYDHAAAAYSIGRVDEAEENLRRALQLGRTFPHEKSAREFLEFIALAAQPPLDASEVDRIERLAKENPDRVPVLMVLAAIRERGGDTPATKSAYEQVLNRYPDFSPAQRKLALLHAASPANDAKSVALALKARLAFPDDPQVARAAGIIAYRQGDFARAAALLAEAATKSTPDGELMYHLGMAQYRANQRSAGKASLLRALDLGVQEPWAAEARKSLAALE